jgi:hypothetical protein
MSGFLLCPDSQSIRVVSLEDESELVDLVIHSDLYEQAKL